MHGRTFLTLILEIRSSHELPSTLSLHNFRCFLQNLAVPDDYTAHRLLHIVSPSTELLRYIPPEKLRYYGLWEDIQPLLSPCDLALAEIVSQCSFNFFLAKEDINWVHNVSPAYFEILNEECEKVVKRINR